MDDLRRTMDQHGKLLYPTFLALHKAVEEGDNRVPPLRKKTRFSKRKDFWENDIIIDTQIQIARDAGEREALEELRAAVSVQLRERNEADAAKQKEQQELNNFETARTEGNIAECGCCFIEYAINRMVHCDGDVIHVSNSLYVGEFHVLTCCPPHPTVVLSRLRTNDGRDANRPI